MNWKSMCQRPVIRRLWTAVQAFIILLLLCDLAVTFSSRGRIHRLPEALPDGCVAVVLGTAKTMSDGRRNYFYQARLEAAGLLYSCGKTDRVILSGTAEPHYNEPETMKEDLRQLKVPERAIVLDGRGFRTLDSVLRSKSVFHAEKIVVVSQKFHAERAVFLARAFGIDACGFAADESEPFLWYVKVRIREVGARARAVFDATVMKWVMG